VAAERTLFLDLDGVVLDVSQRYYAVHCDIVAQLGGTPLDFEEFWRLKREMASTEELTGLEPDAAREYRKRWGQLIEGPAYLAMDRYLPQARTALLLLGRDYDVVLVSLRHKAAALRKELEELSLPRVSQVLSAAAKGDPALAKARLMQGSPRFSRNAVVAGDTEVDIQAGKELGLTTIAVRGGLRSDALLSREPADVTIDGIAQLPGVLRELFRGGRP